MILELVSDITAEQKNHLRSLLFDQGCIFRDLPDAGRQAIGVLGKGDRPTADFGDLPGVARVVPIETPFKMVSRQWHPADSRIRVGNVTVGGERIVIMAGPCAVESREQALTIAREVKRYGATCFRGGAYKPRTSPYSFQGLEEEGLKILAEVRAETGMPVVTEMTSTAQVDLMAEYVDVVQIGARNMQNFELLKCVGRMGKPVLLKRGLAATIKEWLMSAEYILSEGNDQVILCERGIRTFEPYTRNTLDLSAIPILKKLTHLPVLIDPSHATGIRAKVPPMARAAVAAGADALMVEVHHDPDNALSDGPQSLYPEQFGQLTRDIYVIAPVVGKQLDFDYLEKGRRTSAGAVATDAAQGRAACAGELGSFNHMALSHYFGDAVEAVVKSDSRGVFQAVADGQAAYGILPVENTLMGSIRKNYDLLLEYKLPVVGELDLRIVHHLIARPGTRVEQIKRVIATPQAMAQCRQYLERRPEWTLVAADSSAAAVHQVALDAQGGTAAIGSSEATRRFELAIVDEGIDTNPRNFTRFIVIGHREVPGQECRKTALVFSTGNEPGALVAVLQVFSERRINLVKLESRPILGKPWKYMFLAELEIDGHSEAFNEVMATLEEKTDILEVLGSY